MMILFKYFLSCLSYGFLAPYLIKNKPSLSVMLELVDVMDYNYLSYITIYLVLILFEGNWSRKNCQNFEI